MARISKGQIAELILKDQRGEFGEQSLEDLNWLFAEGGRNWREYLSGLCTGRLVAVPVSSTVGPSPAPPTPPTPTLIKLPQLILPTDDSVFTIPLDYTGGAGLIGRLADSGAPWGYRNPGISDADFPVTGEGIAQVKFRIIPGSELKSSDGWVWRNKVETKFRKIKIKMGMRFPNPAEALLPSAVNQQVGRVRPLVAFIGGSSHAFIVHEDGRGRGLDLYSGSGRWGPDYDFLGVCE